LPNLVDWCTLVVHTPHLQALEKTKIQDGGLPQFWNLLNMLFTTGWPVLMKFGMIMHLYPLHPVSCSQFWILKNPRWLRAS